MSTAEQQTRQRPIGVFDSGLGGLSAVREIRTLLPQEDLIYFGDTGRVPYGTKSEQTIRKYAAQDAAFLAGMQPKALVVACGTVSSVALDECRKIFSPGPVLGVIEPACSSALKTTHVGRIGVLATETTVRSGAFRRALQQADVSVQVREVSCPLFVPLVENGFFAPDDPIPQMVARRYLHELAAWRPDTVILGCTHYPHLRSAIAAALPQVALVDTGAEVARALAQTLTARDMRAKRENGRMQFFVTDTPQGFSAAAEIFLGQSVDFVTQVHIGEREYFETE